VGSIIDTYTEALAEGDILGAYEFDGYWSDVGTPQRYADVLRDAEQGMIDLKGRLGSGEVG
jgi:NDP-sugar pyrophosphorylase family protein